MVSGENPVLAGPCASRRCTARSTPDLRELKNSEDENGDNFFVRTLILVNLSFFEKLRERSIQ
jgi:hypothetical protein